MTRVIAAFRQLDLSRLSASRPPVRLIGRARHLNGTQVAELAEGYHFGATMRELSKRFGVSRTTLAAHLRCQGVEVRPRSLTDQEGRQARSS